MKSLHAFHLKQQLCNSGSTVSLLKQRQVRRDTYRMYASRQELDIICLLMSPSRGAVR